MLPDAEENDGDTGGMHHADQAAYHVANRVAFADDETVQPTGGPKRRVEAACLRHAVASHECLTDHEDLVRFGECGEFLERRHESGIVVATSRGVDQYDVEFLRCCVRHGVLGDVGRVFAITLFVQLDFAAAFPLGEFLKVPGVYTELLNSTRAEGVARRDEEGEIILEKEKCQFRQVGGFAHSVDPHDGNYIRPRRRGKGV